jgi:hypothetical protein
MILDKQLAFSEAQAVTGAATSASTDLIDLSVVRSNIGSGKDLFVVVNVDVAAGGTTPTMAVLIQTDDNASFSSATTLFTGPTIAAAGLALSTQLVYQIPATGMERYLRLAYTLGGTSPTITVSAHIVENFHLSPNYASGFSVQ